jgi:IS30 family transposase
MPGKRLTEIERHQIEVLHKEGLSLPQIAARIGRDRTTIWRELALNRRPGPRPALKGTRFPRHNVGEGEGYCARIAQVRAEAAARRPRQCKLIPAPGFPHPPLRAAVAGKLGQRWSPRQISRWLARTFPDHPELHVSTETIYQAIYLQGRGSLREELGHQAALRSGRAVRKAQSRAASAARSKKPWVDGLNISTRPADVSDRAVPGHWEGDLLIGARGSSAIVTLVERATRFVMLGALPDSRVSEEVTDVLIELMTRVPGEMARTLTWDQGSEMARHASFTLATDCKVFFCDPHSPWQRGSNENTNGLLRQYFPRSSTDFRTYTQDDLDAVARELNGRPRETLNWNNPAEALNEFLVATAA